MSDRVEVLIKKLNSTDRGIIKASVVDELGSTGDRRGLRPIIDTLSDADAIVRWNAIKAVAKFGDDAVRILINRLDTADRYLRRNIIQALGELGGSDVTDRLIRLLMFDETDKDVLIEVIRSLQKIRSPRAVEPLITVLKMDDWEMKWRAIHTLGNIGDPRAVEPLLEVMNNSDPDIKWAANVAIENIKRAETKRETDPSAPARPVPALQPRSPHSRKLSDIGLTTSAPLGRIVIHVKGELNSENSQIFRGYVEGVISTSTDPLELDLAQCDFIDSFALGVLNNIRKKLKSKKRTFKLSRMNPHVRDIFKTTKLDTIFEIED